MPRIHVCSLQRLHDTVREVRAGHVLTVMKNIDKVATPTDLSAERHLKLEFSDIIAPQEGEVMASAAQVQRILDFAHAWERAAPMVIHCFAGISRSTASAFMSACALRPEVNEAIWADAIRKASPTATPNIHLVSLADDIMERKGRMVDAIRAIGRGEDCFEGVPFALDIGTR